MLLRSGRAYYNQHNSFDAFCCWFNKNILSQQEVEERGGVFPFDEWWSELEDWCDDNNHIITMRGIYNLDAW